MTQYIFFDLDGTLVDSYPGITKSIQYAMQELGKDVPPAESLVPCIGPPLITSFTEMLGLSESEGEKAVDLYRERYNVKGMYELEIYEGIQETLQSLSDKGFTLFVATSKPQIVAQKIVEHCKLSHHFRKVYGAGLDGQHKEKDSLLAHLLETENIDPANAVMVGDRKFDMIGSVKNKLTPLGVTYGFGSAEELNNSGARFLAHSPGDILDIVTSP